jgi:hypothetical protein
VIAKIKEIEQFKQDCEKEFDKIVEDWIQKLDLNLFRQKVKKMED